MPNVIISANMSLPIPVVGTDPGPDYATNLNSSLTIIDSHNHTSGSGVPITVAAININTDLPFNGNNAITLRSVRFTAQGSPLALVSDLGCLYESGADLYYNDGVGNQVRITQSGAVAGTPGSISNLVSPASASYDSGTGTFIFESDASVPGNLDGASITIREQTTSPNGITISSPVALSSNYTLTLPGALPAAQRFVTIDNSGNIAATWNTDNVTTEVVANAIQVKNGGITLAKMAAQSVSQTQLIARTLTTTTVAAGGIGISASSGSVANGAGAPVLIPNHDITITTLGRPVMIMMQSDGSGAEASIGTDGSAGASETIILRRNGTDIATVAVENSGTRCLVPPSSFQFVDVVAAGTYQYQLYFERGASNIGNAVINFTKMVVYEQ